MRKEKTLSAPGLFRALLGIAAVSLIGSLHARTPVVPNATQTTKDVLNYLEQVVNDGKILSGQQLGFYITDLYNTDTSGSGPGAGPGSPGGQNDYSEFVHIHDETGQWPAILGLNSERANRGDLVDVALQQWNDGGLVSFSSAQRNPIDNSMPHTTNLTAAQYDDLLTPGTAIYNNWLAYIDLTASHFKTLRDAGVVVIWRPYHESSDGNFWWAKQGATRYKQLWRNMFNRYTNHHNLNNLIWCWSPKHPVGGNQANWYPGNDYVDIGGDDIYTSSRSVNTARYNQQLSDTPSSKLITLAEVGQLLTPSEFQTTDWAWFLCWRGFIDSDTYPPVNGHATTKSEFKQVYNASNVINRADLPNFNGSSGGSGFKWIRNKINGQYLRYSSGSSDVIVSTIQTGWDSPKWEFIDSNSPGYVWIRNKDNGLYLRYSSGANDAIASTIQTNWNSPKWKIENSNSTGYVWIKNKQNGLYLRYSDSANDVLVTTIQTSWNSPKWQLVDTN